MQTAFIGFDKQKGKSYRYCESFKQFKQVRLLMWKMALGMKEKSLDS